MLDTVRKAPPPQFSGGGFWEAMHGSMNGYYEIRITGPGRMQHRLFCILDNADAEGLKRRGFDRPQIAVINGMSKKSGEKFTDAGYKRSVRDLGDDYPARFLVASQASPRSGAILRSSSSVRPGLDSLSQSLSQYERT